VTALQKGIQECIGNLTKSCEHYLQPHLTESSKTTITTKGKSNQSKLLSSILSNIMLACKFVIFLFYEVEQYSSTPCQLNFHSSNSYNSDKFKDTPNTYDLLNRYIGKQCLIISSWNCITAIYDVCFNENYLSLLVGLTLEASMHVPILYFICPSCYNTDQTTNKRTGNK
jgi:hypothetical protein